MDKKTISEIKDSSYLNELHTMLLNNLTEIQDFISRNKRTVEGHTIIIEDENVNFIVSNLSKRLKHLKDVSKLFLRQKKVYLEKRKK